MTGNVCALAFVQEAGEINTDTQTHTQTENTDINKHTHTHNSVG